MKIEKNIPIPKKKTKVSKWFSIVSEMKEGDSILCDSYKEALGLMVYIKRCGFNATQRIEGFKYRVWKVKR